MSTNDDADEKAAKAMGAEARTTKQTAEDGPTARPGAHSMGQEGEIEAGPDTQMAPGILDSGPF